MDEMFDLFISGYISKFIAVCFCISMQKIAIRTSTYVSNSTNRFHGESKSAKKSAIFREKWCLQNAMSQKKSPGQNTCEIKKNQFHK